MSCSICHLQAIYYDILSGTTNGGQFNNLFIVVSLLDISWDPVLQKDLYNICCNFSAEEKRELQPLDCLPHRY